MLFVMSAGTVRLTRKFLSYPVPSNRTTIRRRPASAAPTVR